MIENRYGCNDYFDLERNLLESGPTQDNDQTEAITNNELKGGLDI